MGKQAVRFPLLDFIRSSFHIFCFTFATDDICCSHSPTQSSLRNNGMLRSSTMASTRFYSNAVFDLTLFYFSSALLFEPGSGASIFAVKYPVVDRGDKLEKSTAATPWV